MLNNRCRCLDQLGWALQRVVHAGVTGPPHVEDTSSGTFSGERATEGVVGATGAGVDAVALALGNSAGVAATLGEDALAAATAVGAPGDGLGVAQHAAFVAASGKTNPAYEYDPQSTGSATLVAQSAPGARRKSSHELDPHSACTLPATAQPHATQSARAQQRASQPDEPPQKSLVGGEGESAGENESGGTESCVIEDEGNDAGRCDAPPESGMRSRQSAAAAAAQRTSAMRCIFVAVSVVSRRLRSRVCRRPSVGSSR